MSKFSKLLLSLLRLSLSRLPDLTPHVYETKEVFISRFKSDLVMAIRYPDKDFRQYKASQLWLTIKFIEAKTKIQKQGEDTQTSL